MNAEIEAMEKKIEALKNKRADVKHRAEADIAGVERELNAIRQRSKEINAAIDQGVAERSSLIHNWTDALQAGTETETRLLEKAQAHLSKGESERVVCLTVEGAGGAKCNSGRGP